MNLYEFNLPQAAISDVEDRLRTWAQTNLTNWLTNNSARAEIEVNNQSKYADLRRVYASIALAQWYKSQDKNGLVFSELIDSNNITGINISFNKAFWESQSNQRLTEDIYHGTCFKTGWEYCYSYIYGGVDFKDSKPPTNGSITNGTSDSMANSLITSYVKDGKNYYYSTAIDVEKPNLIPVAMGFSTLSPEPNQTVNITVAVENNGNVNAGNFTVYFYSTFTYPTGEIVKERISIVNMSSAVVDEFALANATWQTPAALGNYNITAVVDYYNAISEANELDNTLTEIVTVFTNFPTATITSPAHNKVSCGDVTLTGSGTDPQDGSLNNTLLNWTSHLQGDLGNGTSRAVNLSLGVHDITLKATDSQGFSDNETLTLNIIPCNPPFPVLLSPSNKTYAEGELIYFNGYALDQEDGAIPNASLVWNSSADGTLNTGASFFSTRTLSVGNHTITLKAIDVTEQIGFAQVNITVEEGTPIINITSPEDGKLISYKAATNFIGNATDPQDGNISNFIVWTSSINGTLGTGGSLNANLSVGTHTVTATVTDSHANTVSASISAEVKPPQYPVASI
ncbi:hypothetical protein HYV84_00070, partial [Candidatus Woesearchaeota archaeon]|nr:hypothetical protein [Candidatus Woesearchaeota archaeon]